VAGSSKRAVVSGAVGAAHLLHREGEAIVLGADEIGHHLLRVGVGVEVGVGV
jgi:hypothetical protein